MVFCDKGSMGCAAIYMNLEDRQLFQAHLVLNPDSTPQESCDFDQDI